MMVIPQQRDLRNGKMKNEKEKEKEKKKKKEKTEKKKKEKNSWYSWFNPKYCRSKLKQASPHTLHGRKVPS